MGFLFLTANLFGYFVSLFFGGFSQAPMVLVQLISYALSGGATIMLALQLKNHSAQPPPLLRFGPVNSRAVAVLIPVTLALGVLLDAAMAPIPMPEWVKKIFEEAIGAGWLGFLQVVILAPIVEEIIFRGVVLEGFLQRYSPTKAILWSAFMFGFIHMNPWQLIGGFGLGVLMGWVYYRTRNLWLPILIHLINNLFAFVLMQYGNFKADTTLQSVLPSAIAFVALLAISLLVVVVGIWWLHKHWPKPLSF